jgi:hypothetical protein
MNVTKPVYFFFDNGVVLVRAGPEAIAALKNIADDIATDLNKLKDVWDQSQLLIDATQSILDAASGSDHLLDSATATGAVAFGIGIGLAIGGTGAAAVAGGIAVGYLGDLLYDKAIEAAKKIGSRAGEAAWDLWGDKYTDPDTNGSWNGARNWCPAPVDPFALDLDGDGLETVGIDAYNTVVFDHDGDGIRTGTDWFKIHADSATVVHGGYGGGGGSSNGGYLILPSETEATRLAALDAEQQRIIHMISVLERFNGQGFVDIKDERITHGNGSHTSVVNFTNQSSWNSWTGGAGGLILLGQEVTRYASASLSAAQITLLEQSYSQLKESIYYPALEQ